MSDFSVEMVGITKRFPNVLALDGVDFRIRAGEIHALLGENGAGKTTLMKVLYGMYRPDSGEIFVKGERVRIRSPRDAIKLGIGMVHQRFLLVDSLSVLENIVLGEKMQTVLPLRELRGKVEEMMEKFKLKVDLDAKVWQIPVGDQQKVEILKAMYRGAKILILDEPTSMIAPPEYETLFASLRELSGSGASVVFITHKLREALRISDTITVMRRGRVVAECGAGQVDEAELARLMIGEDLMLGARHQRRPRKDGPVLLQVSDLHVENDRGMMAVKGVSFDLRGGEILGVVGVSGNGQSELMEAIVGMRKPKSGAILLDGKDLRRASVRERMQLGIAYIPESKRIAMSPGLSVSENAVLRAYRSGALGNMIMRRREVLEFAEDLVNSFNVVAPSLEMPAKFLSGGNAQKVIIARELLSEPRVIVAGNPTSGLDVSSTELTHRHLLEARERGVAVLLFSEDVEEALELSDRVAVMFDGRIVRFFEEVPSAEELGLAMVVGS
jgi:simple sugar transport system ATP-binding protein